MNPRRSVRLSLESLEGRALPGATPTQLLPPAAVTSATTSSTAARTVQINDLSVAQGAKRHYPHIRVAMLAYTGTPVGAVEQKLLRESVDLVIPNVSYLNRFDALAPGTPQMIYTNVSNIYLELLTDWLNYADRHGFDREGAFYHVNKATPFRGDSGSSRAGQLVLVGVARERRQRLGRLHAGLSPIGAGGSVRAGRAVRRDRVPGAVPRDQRQPPYSRVRAAGPRSWSTRPRATRWAGRPGGNR